MYQELKAMEDFLVKPKYPIKPKLASNTPSPEELEEYNIKVQNYPLELDQYTKLKEKYYEDVNRIYEFIKQEGGLYDIPEKYQNKVWTKALEKDSYFAIYQELDSLTELFMID